MNLLQRTSKRKLLIDDVEVTLVVTRLSIRDYHRLAALGYPRGVFKSDPNFLSRVEYLSLVSVFKDVEVDGKLRDVTLNEVFGAREDVVAQVYGAVMSAQTPSEEELDNIETVLRFTMWLSEKTKEVSGSPWVETRMNCGLCLQKGLAEKRGCEAPKKKPVWHNAGYKVYRCPVRSFTPDAEQAVNEFFLTHVPTQNGYVMAHLPEPVGLSGQEMWKMAAFQHVNRVLRRVAESPKNG